MKHLHAVVRGAAHFPASGVTDSSVRASLEIAAQENKDWWTSVVTSRGMQGDTLYAPWAPEGGVTVKGQGTYYPSPNQDGGNDSPSKKNRTGFAQLTSNDFLQNLIGAGIGTLAGGGGASEMASTLLPMIGSAWGPIGSAIGSVVGTLLGGLFGKKKNQTPVTEPIPVKVVNLGDLATAFLAATQSRRLLQTGPGMNRLTTELSLQGARVGVV
jgi:hypothetical protein